MYDVTRYGGVFNGIRGVGHGGFELVAYELIGSSEQVRYCTVRSYGYKFMMMSR